MINNTDVYCPYCHKSDPSPLNVETVKYSGLEVSLIGHGTVMRAVWDGGHAV